MISPATLVTRVRRLAVTAGASKMPNWPCRPPRGPPPRPPAGHPAMLGGAPNPGGEQLRCGERRHPPRPSCDSGLATGAPRLSPPSLPPWPSRSPAQGWQDECGGQVIDRLSEDEGARLIASPWRGASRSIFMAAIFYTPEAVTSRLLQSQQPLKADKSPLAM